MWPEPVQRVASCLARAPRSTRPSQEFPEGTPTAEAAARAVGCRLEQIVKSLVFVCDGAYVLALVPGDRRADEREGRGRGRRRRRRASRARRRSSTATGFEPGARRAVPDRASRTVLIERTLLQHGRVWIGAGSRRTWLALARPTCSASPGRERPISSAPR